MLEVVPDSIADEDHLLLELSIFVVLGHDFPEEREELSSWGGSVAVVYISP